MATVDELIAQQNTRIGNFTTDFELFIDALLNAVNVTYSMEEVLAGHQPLGQALGAIDAMIGDFPDLPEQSVPAFQVPPVPDIALQPIVANMDTLDEARGKLLQDLQDGGYGIDTSDEAQIVDRARDRAVAESQAAVAELERAFANRRFSIAPGALWDPLEMAKEQVRRTISDVSRDVHLRRADQFFRARQFAIQTAGVADQTRVAIQVAEFQTYAEAARITLQLFESQLNHYRTLVFDALERARLTVRVFEARASLADTKVRAALARSQTTIASYQANTQSFLGVIQSRISNARNQLDAQVAEVGARTTAAQSGAQLFANIISSAAGAQTALLSKTEEA